MLVGMYGLQQYTDLKKCRSEWSVLKNKERNKLYGLSFIGALTMKVEIRSRRRDTERGNTWGRRAGGEGWVLARACSFEVIPSKKDEDDWGASPQI